METTKNLSIIADGLMSLIIIIVVLIMFLKMDIG